MLCSLGVFVLPVLGAAIAYRRTRVGRISLWAVAIAMLAMDSAILLSTGKEGWSYFHKVRRSIPEFLAAWIVSWIAWQVLVVYYLARQRLGETA
jgi:uncharacterized membrane protein